MTTTTTKTEQPGIQVAFTKSAQKKANDMMSKFAKLTKKREALLETIADELSGYDKQLKEARASLIEMGEIFKPHFDEKDRLELEEGYLIISHSSTVKQGRNFDLDAFHDAYPEMVEVSLKLAPIKKAFLDADKRKVLKTFGVSVDTEESIQVKMHKLTE